jgi:hypothetical protein
LLEEFLLVAWAFLDWSTLKETSYKFPRFFSTSSPVFRRKRRQKGGQQLLKNARQIG